MEVKLWFILLCSVVALLLYIIGFWRRKAGEAAFAAAQLAENDEQRDNYCRLGVLAGNRNACCMFCLARPDFFEDRQPLKPFKSRGVKTAFYGHYYPSRYQELLNGEQRAFCQSLYEFKEGEEHGIEFFKACLSALQLNGLSCHVMFIPCSTEAKYFRRFGPLHEYIVTSRPELTSGLHDVDVFEDRESLHNAKGSENRVLERNYRITGNLEGKQVVIVDDVLTTGQSMADYKGEIERCGGKVVAAVFYGKTVTMSPPFLVKVYVWGSYITDLIGELAKPSDKRG